MKYEILVSDDVLRGMTGGDKYFVNYGYGLMKTFRTKKQAKAFIKKLERKY